MIAATSKDLSTEILNKAKELFIEHGYHGLSMRQIAEAVEVTKAALYYHFKDKEALFLAILGAYLDEIQAAIEHILTEGTNSRQRIHLLVKHILRQPPKERAVIRLASQEMTHLSAPVRQQFRIAYKEQFIDLIRSILKDGIAKGEFRAMDSYLATWTLLGMIFPYLYPVHSDELEISDETIEQMMSIYFDGITSPAE